MSVTIDVEYQGELRCVAKHGPSGRTLTTDAPLDNHGRGESFSPTDLLASALGACVLTIMGIVAARHQWDLSGATAQVTKEMITAPVRRIGRLPITIRIPTEQARQLSSADRVKLEAAAHHCPVHASLHPDIQVDFRFVYDA